MPRRDLSHHSWKDMGVNAMEYGDAVIRPPGDLGRSRRAVPVMAAATGILAFQARHSVFEFVAADAGIGRRQNRKN